MYLHRRIEISTQILLFLIESYQYQYQYHSITYQSYPIVRLLWLFHFYVWKMQDCPKQLTQPLLNLINIFNFRSAVISSWLPFFIFFFPLFKQKIMVADTFFTSYSYRDKVSSTYSHLSQLLLEWNMSRDPGTGDKINLWR